MNNKPELLAPAGNLEKAKTALAFGADAIYLGVPDFSLRVRINDFDLDSVRTAVEYAHSLGKKAYVTLNIFAHNQHLEALPAHVSQLKEIKPDGLFVSDPGVLAAAREVWPEANYILSTQANCTNWRSAKFWQDQGLSRVILGRELSLAEVKEIKDKVPGLELECFVHGALCMAYSGRCFISKFLNGRDANLGDCSQPCRWNYKLRITNYELEEQKVDDGFELVEEEHGSYVLNSEDLCLVRRLPELMAAGIDAFKIEGRAKSVYYLACVVGAYRRAIDLAAAGGDEAMAAKELAFLHEELNTKLVHRGYTEGFMFGQGRLAQNLENSHNRSEWEFCGQVAKIKNYELSFDKTQDRRITNEGGFNFVKVHNSLKVGDVIEVVEPGYDIIKIKVDKLFDLEGNSILEAHGGQEQVAVIPAEREWGDFSVVRRKLLN